MKIHLISLLFFILPLVAFAQWDQKMIALDDPLYEEIELLFRQQGETLPSLSFPWTRDQAVFYIEHLNSKSKRSQSLLAELKDLRGTFSTAESFSFAIPLSLSLDLQGWAILDSKGETLEAYPFVRRARDREPLLDVPLSLSLVNDRLYLELDISIKEDINTDWENPQNISNIPMDYYDVDLSFPHSAYFSTGGDHWNFMIGRSLQDWGSGRTGNLLLSDSASFHDLTRFKSFYGGFNYTWAFLSLDPRLSEDQRALYSGSISDRLDSFVGSKYLLLHNFEFRPIPALRIGLTEGLLLGGPDFTLSPSFFNPMMFFHNWFSNIYSQGNAIHMAEIELALGKQLYYTQVCLDQYQSTSEKKYFPLYANEPNAFGLLLGINRMEELKKGYLDLTLEGVWTMPYLYTAGGYYTNHSINELHTGTDMIILNLPLGYSEANDALVFSLMGRYNDDDHWNLQSSLSITLKGSKNLTTLFPSGSAATETDSSQIWPTGPVNKKIMFALEGGFEFKEHWNIQMGNRVIYQENPYPLYNEHSGLPYESTFWALEPWCYLKWQK